jgi:citrate lyase subunit beta/citryl-CoA lyase/(S)-citramalyl-CoA lyase
LAVRINSLDGPEGLRDLLAVTGYAHRPAIVLIPKVESARDIDIVANVLTEDGYAPELYALIETPRGIRDLASIVQAPRLSGLIFGAADYALETGCTQRWSSLCWARSAIMTAASYVDIPVIDAPYFQVDDLDGLRRESRLSKELGFSGKIALHPRQVPVINSAFTPSRAEIDQARAVVAAGGDVGTGIVMVEGQMVGPPFFAAAKKLVNLIDADGAASLAVEGLQR